MAILLDGNMSDTSTTSVISQQNTSRIQQSSGRHHLPFPSTGPGGDKTRGGHSNTYRSCKTPFKHKVPPSPDAEEPTHTPHGTGDGMTLTHPQHQ